MLSRQIFFSGRIIKPTATTADIRIDASTESK
jgi:hypothetical protein